MRRVLVLLVSLMLLPTAVAGQRPVASPGSRKVLPRDDSASDPSFLTFRNQLLTAARRGDVAALRASMAPTLSAVFEPATRDQVLAASGVVEGTPWADLVEALELGATKEASNTGVVSFVAPYVFSFRDMDGYEELAVLGRGVRMRRAPDVTAEVVATLAYDVVGLLRDSAFLDEDEEPRLDDPRSWTHVLTSTGATGFVFSKHLRSANDWRFIFEKVDGRWLMTKLATGD